MITRVLLPMQRRGIQQLNSTYIVPNCGIVCIPFRRRLYSCHNDGEQYYVGGGHTEVASQRSKSRICAANVQHGSSFIGGETGLAAENSAPAAAPQLPLR